MILKTIGARLKYILKETGLDLKKFSKKNNFNYTTVQKIASNKSPPTYKSIVVICKNLNITADWFLFGKGEIYQIDHIPESIPKSIYTLSIILEWLNKWDGYDEKNRLRMEAQIQKTFPRYDVWFKRTEKRHPDYQPEQLAPAVWFKKEWEDSDEKYQNWLEIEMEEHFPAYKKWAGRGIRKEKE